MKISVLALFILSAGFMFSSSAVGNYEKNYGFNSQYGFLNQKLYVSVQPSLYNEYCNASHTVDSDDDYANFVTPQAVESIADNIQKVTSTMPHNEELFADAVLTMVHKIPYNISGVKYPVETLVNNYGDCVALSTLAASIMKAGGLDVVLIHYTGIDPSHLNVGVYLPHTPVYHNLLMFPTSFTYNNKTYWTAESTPEMDWKVGDQSSSLIGANAVVIPLDNLTQSVPGEVSSSLGSQLSSSILTLNLSSIPQDIQNTTRAFNISGSILPSLANEKVTFFVSQNTSSSDYFQTYTDDAGNYALTWNITSLGTYYIKTSWSGDSNYSGADSDTQTVFVGPESFVQYQTPHYSYILEQTNVPYYIFGSEYIPSNVLHSLQGTDDFLSIPLGTNISFTYQFAIMQTGHSSSNITTETITVPGEQILSLGRHGPTRIVRTTGETLVVPKNVPSDMEPLILPDDFNQTINNQFCFLIQNNSTDEYSLKMEALNSYEISNITQDESSNISFFNVSNYLQDNTWYTVTESISENQISANINNANGTLLASISAPSNESGSQVVLLVTNNVDNAVVLKNVSTQNQNTYPQTTNSKKPGVAISLLNPYVTLAIFAVAAFTIALVYIKKKKVNEKNKRVFFAR